MKELTPKEEEVMNLFWTHGALFVRELQELYPEPRPHFNTLSTVVRGLEDKGFVGHESFGPTHRYFAKLSREEVGGRSIKSIVNRFFGNSYLGIVSSLVKDEEVSIEELRRLIDEVENNGKDIEWSED